MTPNTPKAAPVRAKDWKELLDRYAEFAREIGRSSMVPIRLIHESHNLLLETDLLTAAENDRTSGLVVGSCGHCHAKFSTVDALNDHMGRGEFDFAKCTDAKLVAASTSCMACGHAGERSVESCRYPEVYVCKTCTDKIRSHAAITEPKCCVCNAPGNWSDGVCLRCKDVVDDEDAAVTVAGGDWCAKCGRSFSENACTPEKCWTTGVETTANPNPVQPVAEAQLGWVVVIEKMAEGFEARVREADKLLPDEYQNGLRNAYFAAATGLRAIVTAATRGGEET